MKATLSLFWLLTLVTPDWAATLTQDAQPPVVPAAKASPKPGDADFPTPAPSPRHTEKVAAVRSGRYDLMLIGDSIFHSLGEIGGKYEPLKAVWDRHYAPRHAINLAHNGYRTEQILWNLQEGELDFAQSPKAAILLIGTNNSDDRHFAKVHTAEEIFAGTKAIVELIKQRHPTTKILILRIFPRGGDGQQGVSPPAFNSSALCIETCRRAGELTAKLADGQQVFWLDVNYVFLRPDGTINTDLMWDLLHPSPAGAEAWAQAIEPTVAQLMDDKPLAVDVLNNSALVPVPKLENDSYHATLSSHAAAASKPSPPEDVVLWPDQAPVGDGTFEQADASITVFRPVHPNGAAAVICPGGGYGGLVMGAEGSGIAQWLNAHGITGIVLRYRLPHGRAFVPLLDAQRAIRLARTQAKEWGYDAHRIGIIGFSAGGHLASTAATHFDGGKAAATDPIERVSCRPDFAVLVYPVITMGEKAHGGSRQNLLGPAPAAETIELFSNEKQVTAETPPTFLAHALDDRVVSPDQSRFFYEALQAHKVPARYLELPSGDHGLNGYKGPMWDAWQSGALNWLASLKLLAQAAELDAVGPVPLSDLTLHVIPQAHIDLAWWWRYDPETVQIVAEHTLETAYGNLEKFPDYTFTYLQVPAIEPLETLNPKLFYRLRYYTHRPEPMENRLPNPEASGVAGRLAIGSALWCELDACVPCGESLVRQCLYGKRYFQRVFGIDVRTAWFQDAWTHPWTYPQILKKSGIDSYMFTRPRGEGETMFWWESADGSRVFAYKPLIHDGDSLPPQEALNQRLITTQQRYGVKDDLTLIGVGNHGGGAIRADVERMRALMAQRTTDPKPATVKFSTPARFVEAVLREPHDFPVIRTELPPTIRGAYTSGGEIKKGNRQSENLLLTAEKFSAIAARLGLRRYPQTLLFEAWQKVMLNQFHDTISGTEVPPAMDDALERYRQVQSSVGAELEAALSAIAARAHTEGRGVPVLIFNPLAWERTEIAECELEFEDSTSVVAILDDDGRSVPVQVLTRTSPGGRNRIRFAFSAQALPSLGYRTFWAQPGAGTEESNAIPNSTPNELENAFFRIRIDLITGCVASIYDKVHQREVLDAKLQGNLIQVLEDFGDSEGFLKNAQGEIEHNVWDGRSWDVASEAQVSWVENGPVRQAVQIKKKFGLARFTQRVALPQAVPRVDFELAIAWEGTNRMVKVAFPLSISSSRATCEIPYGTIARKSNGEECVAQNWVDISEGGYGVSLLNDSRYGHDFAPNVIRLSVLRSPDHPVATAEQRGVHRIRYALYPHAGSWQEAGLPRRGQEWNNPPIALAATPHSGDLPSRYSFLEVSPENVIVSVLKKAEDSDAILLRCYESTGASCSARFTLAGPLKIDTVHTTDLLEQSRSECASQSSGFQVPVGAWSIETFKLIKDPE